MASFKGFRRDAAVMKRRSTRANHYSEPGTALLHALHHPERTMADQVVRGKSEPGHQFLDLGIGKHTVKRVTLRFSIRGVYGVKQGRFTGVVIDQVLLAPADRRQLF